MGGARPAHLALSSARERRSTSSSSSSSLSPSSPSSSLPSCTQQVQQPNEGRLLLAANTPAPGNLEQAFWPEVPRCRAPSPARQLQRGLRRASAVPCRTRGPHPPSMAALRGLPLKASRPHFLPLIPRSRPSRAVVKHRQRTCSSLPLPPSSSDPNSSPLGSPSSSPDDSSSLHSSPLSDARPPAAAAGGRGRRGMKRQARWEGALQLALLAGAGAARARSSAVPWGREC